MSMSHHASGLNPFAFCTCARRALRGAVMLRDFAMANPVNYAPCLVDPHP